MAVFEKEYWKRKDWDLLQNGPISLYYRQEVLQNDLEWLREHDYEIDDFNCGEWQTKLDLHEALADQLDFPGYYGHNLDALNDCLCDIAVPDQGGRVIVFHQYDWFFKLLPEVAWHVLDIFASNARIHLLFGKRLIVLVQSDDPRINFKPVGACPVYWNRREWLNSNRGL